MEDKCVKEFLLDPGGDWDERLEDCWFNARLPLLVEVEVAEFRLTAVVDLGGGGGTSLDNIMFASVRLRPH